MSKSGEQLRLEAKNKIYHSHFWSKHDWQILDFYDVTRCHEDGGGKIGEIVTMMCIKCGKLKQHQCHMFQC